MRGIFCTTFGLSGGYIMGEAIFGQYPLKVRICAFVVGVCLSIIGLDLALSTPSKAEPPAPEDETLEQRVRRFTRS